MKKKYFYVKNDFKILKWPSDIESFVKFIFKRLRRYWQSLRCLITPFPSASHKAVRKTGFGKRPMEEQGDCFGSWWGRAH